MNPGSLVKIRGERGSTGIVLRKADPPRPIDHRTNTADTRGPVFEGEYLAVRFDDGGRERVIDARLLEPAPWIARLLLPAFHARVFVLAVIAITLLIIAASVMTQGI